MARSIRSKAGKRNRTERRTKLHAKGEQDRLLRLAQMQSTENSKPYDFEHTLKDTAMEVETTTKGRYIVSKLIFGAFSRYILFIYFCRSKNG